MFSLYCQVEKLVNDEAVYREKVQSMDSDTEALQLEVQANRETICRLTSEKDQLAENNTQYSDEINRLQKAISYFFSIALLSNVFSPYIVCIRERIYGYLRAVFYEFNGISVSLCFLK